MSDTTFEQTYAAVPIEQRQLLHEFRARHPYQEMTIKGVRRRYIACGEGSHALLLLHGAFVRPDMWFYVIRALENDYHIIAPDLSEVFTADVVEAMLRGIMEAQGVQKATVIGLSGGGGIAQHILQAHPDRVAHAVLSHCTAIRAEWTRRGQRMIVLLKIMPLALIRVLLRRRSKSYPASSAWAVFARAYFRERISTIRKETIVCFFEAGIETSRNFVFAPQVLASWPGEMLILSTKDDQATFNGLEALKARYPRARTHIFDQGGHHTFMLFPETYTAVLKGFLDEVLLQRT